MSLVYCDTCDDMVKQRIRQGNYCCIVCNNILSYLPQRSRKKPKICNGCGNTYYHNTHYGYCSQNCLFEYNLKLAIEKNIDIPIRLKPKIQFNKLGLLYEPQTEDEIIFLFAKLHRKLGYKYVKIVRQEYPDCIALNNNNKTIRIEFEYKSSRFNHNIDECDVIICWEHDWLECPKKVIELRKFINCNNHTNNQRTLFDYF